MGSPIQLHKTAACKPLQLFSADGYDPTRSHAAVQQLPDQAQPAQLIATKDTFTPPITVGHGKPVAPFPYPQGITADTGFPLYFSYGKRDFNFHFLSWTK
jgi:hypothetical protein